MTVECACRKCKYTSPQVSSNILIRFPDESLKLCAQNCGKELISKDVKKLHENYFECSQCIKNVLHKKIHIKQTRKKQSGCLFIANNNISSCLDAIDDNYKHVPINSLCRICNNESSEEVFSPEGCRVELIEKVNPLLPISVKNVEKKPKRICMKCCDKVKSFYKLVVTSIKTDIKFRRHLNLETNECYDSRFVKIIEECKTEQLKEENCGKKLELKNNLESWKFASKEKLIQQLGAKMYSTLEGKNDDFNIRCDICKDYFECQETYRSHRKVCEYVEKAQNEINNPSHMCNFCGKCFSTSSSLRGHKIIHLKKSDSKSYICDICGKSFRSRICLEDHINEHSGNKPYDCTLCGKAFGKKIWLEQHKISHSDIRYNCPICNAAFNRKGNLAAHVKHHATKDGMYTCSVCDQKYPSMRELKIHRKVHSVDDILENAKKNPNRKLIWQCKICNKIYSKHSQLIVHESTHTAKRITFDCDECGKKLASKNSLNYHKHSFHSLMKPHMCQYCGDSFVSKELRFVHERKHTGERPFECNVCQKRFRCSTVLNVHLKTHSNERSHVCQYCKKTFTRKGTLVIHERIHTGEKPYSCAICKRSFTQRYDMIKHMRTHKNKSIKCEQCNETFQMSDDILKHLEYHKLLETGKQIHVEN